MHNRILPVLLLALTGCCFTGFSQTKKVDSIRACIHATDDERSKLKHVLAYCEEYQSLNRDTAYNYALLALDLSKRFGNEESLAKAELAFANSYYVWGWVDSALEVCESALKKYTAANPAHRDVYFKLLRQKAFCYGGISEYPKALDVLFNLLRQAEQYNDSITIASTNNSLASVYIAMGRLGEARQWVTKAEKYTGTDNHFLPVRANIVTNSANILNQLNKNDSALHYIRQAVALSRQVQNLNTLATALRIQSNVYMHLGNFQLAEAALREMMTIRNTLSGITNITDDNIQLADFYAASGRLDKAIQLCKDNLFTGDPAKPADTTPRSYTNRINLRLTYFEALARYYQQAGLHEEYTATLEQIIAAKDSFYASNAAESLAEMEARYQTEQKEKTIIRQQLDLTRKNFFIYGSLALLLLSSVIFYLLFREYRRKQQLRMQDAMAEEKAAALVAIKEAEDKERKRIAADLHDNLGVQANAILYNAGLLKQDTENSERLIDDLHETAQQMLLNLRETLWAMKTNDIAAADLWMRIISFSKQMQSHYPSIHFYTTGNAPESIQLNAARALNIVLIIQEAVQNAVKHSGSEHIAIRSSYSKEHWTITVADNGSGLPDQYNHQRPDNHGMQNMTERATASAVTLHIQSDNGQGTSVQLHIPFEQPVTATSVIE